MRIRDSGKDKRRAARSVALTRGWTTLEERVLRIRRVAGLPRDRCHRAQIAQDWRAVGPKGVIGVEGVGLVHQGEGTTSVAGRCQEGQAMP